MPRQECGSDADSNAYWKDPDDDLDDRYWKDPHPPSRAGLLAAQMIRTYALELGMIEPFCEGNLKPASYAMTLGPICQVEGEDRILSTRDRTLTIPPNAMAFVSMREALRLPHYVAARFNLAINYIYRGLLLGTGPQVDPGFQGVLSCPLYNLSNAPIKLSLGDHIATIDFETTTGLPEAIQNAGYANEAELYEHLTELGKEQHIRLFDRKKRWAQPVLGYPPGTSQMRSSVGEAVQEVGNLRRQLRIGAFAATIAAIAVGAAMLGVLAALVVGYWQVANENTAVRSDVQSYRQAQDQALQAQQQKLQRCLTAINAEISAPGSKGLTTLPTECQNIS